MCRCAVSPQGKKSSWLGSFGQGSFGPGSTVNHTGGAASLAQFVLGCFRSAGVVAPIFAVFTGYAIPSLPVATQTPIEKIQAGAAEPQSSSAQAPVAMFGTRRTVILPSGPTSPSTL